MATAQVLAQILDQKQHVFALTHETKVLPDGFPETLNSELAWTGKVFEKTSEYMVKLSQDDIAELENALATFKELELDGDLVCRNNFPLPTLGGRLTALRGDLYQGRGFGLIRGLSPQKYSVEDLTVLQLGIQAYVANQAGKQDKKGNMMVHIVADNSSKMRADHHRHSTAPITFHNEESGDIVSWLTRSTAATGGRCIISSAYTVYNVLAATRPDLIRVLARSDWPFALNGRLITNFGRGGLLGSASHPRPDSLPKLNDKQVEALDAIETIAKATQLEITTQAGDIHLINNFAILHRREGFVNGSENMEKRHLVRMTLRDEQEGWQIPKQLEAEWNKAFASDGRDKVWHLEPMPEGYFPLRKYLN